MVYRSKAGRATEPTNCALVDPERFVDLGFKKNRPDEFCRACSNV
jgi:hypothetical protein